jgi:DNA-binding HxlR family transcriptional regulator
VAGKRTYPDGCAIAYALDVIGERWALLIVRELLYRPRRFTDLVDLLPGISTNSLTQRLKELEGHAIVQRRYLASPADAWVYELTPFGQTLAPVLHALGHWGSTLPQQRAGQPMSVASLLGALHTHFSPERAQGLTFTVGLRLGREELTLKVDGSVLQVHPGVEEHCDLILTSSSTVLTELLLFQASPDQALASGALGVEGKRDLLDHLSKLFPLTDHRAG